MCQFVLEQKTHAENRGDHTAKASHKLLNSIALGVKVQRGFSPPSTQEFGGTVVFKCCSNTAQW